MVGFLRKSLDFARKGQSDVGACSCAALRGSAQAEPKPSENTKAEIAILSYDRIEIRDSRQVLIEGLPPGRPRSITIR